MGRAIADPFTRLLLGYAAPKRGEKVLDLASGTGSVARHIAPMIGVEGQVFAVDINPAMLAVGRAVSPPTGASIEWREGDAVSLDLPDQTFDLVLCQQGLQFFSDRAAALRETRRVMVRNGRAVFSVWQTLDAHPVYKILFETTARHLGAAISDLDVSFSLCNTEQLRLLFADAGFGQTHVWPRSIVVRLPSPEHFVSLTVAGAATSVRAFIRLNAEARADLVTAIAGELDPVIERYTDGGELASKCPRMSWSRLDWARSALNLRARPRRGRPCLQS